jgi:energy-coupling factor transport system permease protein
MLAGMFGLCVGCYGLLGGSGPRFLGIPAILVGAALCCAGLALGSRRVQRTNYRPDPWGAPEWIVSGCGLAGAVLLYLSTSYDANDLNPTFNPLHFPPLPLLPAVAILVAAVAAVAAPPPEHGVAAPLLVPEPQAGREAVAVGEPA